MSKFLSAAASSVVALAIATSASAQTAPAAAPAAPAVTHGPALTGVCIFSSQRAVATSASRQGRRRAPEDHHPAGQRRADRRAHRPGQRSQGSRRQEGDDSAQDALEQQAAPCKVKANAWQRKGQLRQKEVEATEQKALARVYQELDTPIRQVYQTSEVQHPARPRVGHAGQPGHGHHATAWSPPSTPASRP
jgi:Skp family chaperone for outer membrane proteins